MKQLLAFSTWLFRFNSGQTSYYSLPQRENLYSRTMEIRRATLDDLMSVAQIIAESFHSQTGFWGWAFPLFRVGIYEDLRHRLLFSSSHHICLVVVLEGQIIGTVEMAVKFIDTGRWEQKSSPYVSNLAVKPGYRRLGVASKLLAKCEEFSQEWGYQELYLHALEKNTSACQLYFKLQFSISHIDSYLYGLILNGSRQILLHKRISKL